MGGFKVNEKKLAGRQRQAEATAAKKEKAGVAKIEKEDKFWEEGTKKIPKKQLEDEVKKREKQAQIDERRALEAAENRELEKLKPVKPSKEKDSGVFLCSKFASSTPINSNGTNCSRGRSGSHLSSDSGKSAGSSLAVDLRRLSKDSEFEEIEGFAASNIDDAILILDSAGKAPQTQSYDRHPERRAKAAYASFEDQELPKLKAENPTLRLSQLRQILHKMWKKSERNPFNQDHIRFDASREEEVAAIAERTSSKLSLLRI